MAERVLSSFAGKILGDLGSQAFQEVKLLWGFGGNEELDNLKDTVSAIQAVLLDAENQQSTNHQVRDWLNKLEPVLYDADDLLDDLSTELLRRKLVTRDNKCAKKVRIFFSPQNQIVFRFKMGQQVKAIRKRLAAISDDKNTFHFTSQGPQLPLVNRKREESHSYVRAEDVIGREKDKNAIMERLFNSDVQEDVVSVIPIVGIGGLGKTALAQLVYNDDRVSDRFELKTWVCVSEVFDVKLIAQNIIESANRKQSERTQMYGIQGERTMDGIQGERTMDGIQGELRKVIDRKKYFLVLDDVWNEDPELWQQFRQLLMGGVKGSKILLTTRMIKAAPIPDTTSPYALQGLSEEESWSLFKQMAFQCGVEPENKAMVAHGKDIVKKCVGVPLAIRTVGSLLRIKNTEKEWHSLKNKELSEITQQESGIMPLLKLSYNHLPPHLKKCFVYCSVFPKDYKLRKKTLIQLWITQGFIQPSDKTEQLEDIGDEYFMELLRRSFLQDVGEDVLGNVECCKMHDLIHDLAQYVVGKEIRAIGLDGNDVVARTRHASVCILVDSSWEIPTSLLEAKKLRTLFFPIQPTFPRKRDSSQMSESTSNKIISSFKRLRVLDLHGLGIKKMPNFLCNSNHLRYLDLSNNPLELLPKYICKLQNLQTLILNQCTYLKELPRETSDLVSLRHLEIDRCESLTHMPRGLGQLTSLVTLTNFKVFGRDGQDKSLNSFAADISELRNLVNIRDSLEIEGLRGSIIERSKECPNGPYYVSGMEQLERLTLVWDSRETEGVRDDDELMLFERLRPHSHLKHLNIDWYGGVSFPSWMTVKPDMLLPNLVEVSLLGCNRCQHPPRFGLLPSLEYLDLNSMDYLEYVYEEEEEEDCERSGVCHPTSYPSKAPILFPSLKLLSLCVLGQLKGIIGSKRSRREVILRETASSSSATEEESSLTSSFGAARHLPALEELEIRGCPELDLLAQGDENFKQFQSLRRLTISDENLVSLPMGLRHLTNLERLVLWCSKLVVLPEFIGDLTSLRHLSLRWCGSLTSLPDCLRNLKTLERLDINRCPLLADRCQKERGDDWPKIAHIPNLIIQRW